ncbi:MAG: lipoyl(octanoyl) transferase LipB [Chloroflexi bacterium]|nr:lipoyl(octanoyl) transferase LipB [Chloroflexota bacterium]
MKKRVWLLNLGIEPYKPMEALQQTLVDWRQRGLIDDVLILLEHEPVITLGRRADEAHILASPEVLEAEGVQVCRTERGGDVTYHGPGQLVGYPILHLPDYDLGASDYMHRLEDMVAAALAEIGIQTHKREGIIGVWVGENKITALGVRIKRGVTFHGFALNVNPNMLHWSFIIPCGITDGGVTSVALELAHAPTMAEMRARVADHFARMFGVELVPTTVAELEARAGEKVQTV